MAVTRCLRLAGVRPLGIRSANGEEYFHPFPPVRTVLRQMDDWFVQYTRHVGQSLAYGEACCAVGSATFHYVEAPTARFLHSVLGPQRNYWRAANASEREHAWPTDVGGYDRVPARGEESGLVWSLLLDKLGTDSNRSRIGPLTQSQTSL